MQKMISDDATHVCFTQDNGILNTIQLRKEASVSHARYTDVWWNVVCIGNAVLMERVKKKKRKRTIRKYLNDKTIMACNSSAQKYSPRSSPTSKYNTVESKSEFR